MGDSWVIPLMTSLTEGSAYFYYFIRLGWFPTIKALKLTFVCYQLQLFDLDQDQWQISKIIILDIYASNLKVWIGEVELAPQSLFTFLFLQCEIS